MLYVSRETPEETEARLLRVMAAAALEVLDGVFVFEELPANGPSPVLDRRTLAAVRDDMVWSLLGPAPSGSSGDGFGLVRFHFSADLDNSGFVGWLASHLKRTLGTGVFVVCGQNSTMGGIFDYTGFPAPLREPVLMELEALRRQGAALASGQAAGTGS